MVKHVVPTFLGCWALIAFGLVFHFQQNGQLTLFNALAHVEIDT
jgi:hypothetical protein